MGWPGPAAPARNPGWPAAWLGLNGASFPSIGGEPVGVSAARRDHVPFPDQGVGEPLSPALDLSAYGVSDLVAPAHGWAALRSGSARQALCRLLPALPRSRSGFAARP